MGWSVLVSVDADRHLTFITPACAPFLQANESGAAWVVTLTGVGAPGGFLNVRKSSRSSCSWLKATSWSFLRQLCAQYLPAVRRVWRVECSCPAEHCRVRLLKRKEALLSGSRLRHALQKHAWTVHGQFGRSTRDFPGGLQRQETLLRY
jgi:hypothetical protein